MRIIIVTLQKALINNLKLFHINKPQLLLHFTSEFPLKLKLQFASKFTETAHAQVNINIVSNDVRHNVVRGIKHYISQHVEFILLHVFVTLRFS